MLRSVSSGRESFWYSWIEGQKGRCPHSQYLYKWGSRCPLHLSEHLAYIFFKRFHGPSHFYASMRNTSLGAP